MRLLFISDIHGNIEALEACLAVAKQEKPDRIHHLGDIVDYYPDSGACIARVKTFDGVIGNHDYAVFCDEELDTFNPVAREALLWTRNRLSKEDKNYLASLPERKVYPEENYAISHGTFLEPLKFHYMEYNYQVRNNIEAMGVRFLFVGHSHVPCIWSCREIHYPPTNYISRRIHQTIPCWNREIPLEKDLKYVINVGSVGQPRDKNPDGCCVLFDTEQNTIKFLRFSYPIKKTMEKIYQHGLPSFLAERLETGT